MQTERQAMRRDGWKQRAAITPDILQGEHAECGIAALAILLGFHGVHVSLAELRQQSGSLLRGSTLRHLAQLAEKEGFKATAHRWEPLNLKQQELPVIAHMRFIHFVVVEQINDDGVLINDPSCGPMLITPQAFSRDFTGIVLKIQPRIPRRRGTAFSFHQALATCFRPDRILRKAGFEGAVVRYSVAASLLCIASGITAPLGLDILLQQSDQHPFAGVVVFASAGLTFFMALVLSDACCLNLGRMAWKRLVNSIRAAGDEHFLFARPQRTMMLFGAVKDIQATEVMNAFQALLWTMSALLVGAWLHPLPVLLVALLFLTQGLCLWQVYRRRGGVIARFGVGKMPVESVDVDFLSNPNWAAIGYSSDILFNRLAGVHALKASDAIKTAEAWLGPETLITALDVMKFALPILLLIHGQANADATLFALILGVATCFMVPRLKRGLHSKPLRDALVYLHDLPPAAAQPRAAISTTAKVSITQGCWSPTVDAPPVLENVNMSVHSGQVLIVHGPPGCGMTTLARLASGLLTPTHGAVEIGGRAILVDHRLLITPGTIRQNLCLNRADIADSTLLANLEAVDLYQTIHRRGGLDMTLNGDRPRLSGGQLRRLMIARALCHEAGVLVLDEVLDNVETDLAKEILGTLKARGLAVVLTTKNKDLLDSGDQHLCLEET
ncbi:ABC transporter family protein [Agrobacterium vitis]|nr:ABC transporter family protein [Agrobacterium vitis]